MDMYRALVLLHIGFGVVALATFWTAAWLRKGSSLHRRVGTSYLLAMLGVLGTALPMSAVFLSSVYMWPVFDVVGFEVLTHKPSVAAYRAPLAPQTHFAIDSQMDHIARKLGLDPAEYKLRFMQRGGDLMAYKHMGFWQPMDTLREMRMLEPLWESNKAPWRMW